MIKHNDRICAREQFRALRITWPIGIYHHNQGIAAYFLDCNLTVDKHVFRIAFFRSKTFHKRPDGSCWLIDHDLCLFSKHTGCTENSNPCTKGIDICQAVPHDNHVLTALNNFMQRMCLNPRFYTGVALHLFCLASKICNVLTIFDNDLIAAPSECQINCRTCLLIVLVIRSPLDTDTDTQRNRHLIANFDRLDIFKYTEPVIHKFL